MKIVHAADLHIDSPFRGLVRYQGAPIERVRDATRAAFERVIALCLEERASFLVLAGDVFDSGWKDDNSGVYFVGQLARLQEVGCRVLLLRGNHDFDLTQALRFREHVHEFSPPSRKKTGRSFVFEPEGVVFHGVSYDKKHQPDSLLPSYPPPVRDLLNVGVLHTNATGAREHERYAPCSVPELVAHGYDYWALGHVHEHAVLHRDPWVVYPGNTQARHIGERGAKGCVVISVESGRVEEVAFRATDTMRYFHERIELEPDDDREALAERARSRLDAVLDRAEGRLAAVRLTIGGASAAHAAVVESPSQIVAQLRADAQYRGDVWLEKIELATRPLADVDQLREAQGLLGELLRHVAALRDEDAGADRAALLDALDPIRTKLGAELAALAIPLTDPGWLLDRVEEAEGLLVERLTRGEG